MDVGALAGRRAAPRGAHRAHGRGARLREPVLPDSQNLAPEVWGQLMLAAKATSRIRLGPGVTNSVTRDAAVTASAALSLQVESDGRAVLGIGRGDSSVQRIGRTQDPVGAFERYLAAVQGYLRGEAVDRDGFASRLEWLPRAGVPKVPVEVAATGPRVIEVAARHADRICSRGRRRPRATSREKLAHRPRARPRAAGRDPASLRYGAFVNCVVNDDVAAAREAVRGSATTFARFSALPGSRLDRLPAPLRRAAEHIRAHYDMRDHTRHRRRAHGRHPGRVRRLVRDRRPVATALPRFRGSRRSASTSCTSSPARPACRARWGSPRSPAWRSRSSRRCAPRSEPVQRRRAGNRPRVRRGRPRQIRQPGRVSCRAPKCRGAGRSGRAGLARAVGISARARRMPSAGRRAPHREAAATGLAGSMPAARGATGRDADTGGRRVVTRATWRTLIVDRRDVDDRGLAARRRRDASAFYALLRAHHPRRAAGLPRGTVRRSLSRAS